MSGLSQDILPLEAHMARGAPSVVDPMTSNARSLQDISRVKNALATTREPASREYERYLETVSLGWQKKQEQDMLAKAAWREWVSQPLTTTGNGNQKLMIVGAILLGALLILRR